VDPEHCFSVFFIFAVLLIVVIFVTVRVVKEQAGLKPKQWVRIKRGVFKDDLAQVDYVDVASNQVSHYF
jgi:hypothetical protein